MALEYLVVIIFAITIFAARNVAGSYDKSQLDLSSLELRVDARNHARAFCNDLKVVISISNFFEFYERGIDGSRERIFKGPWSGKLVESSSGVFTLVQSDPKSGAAATIVFKQADPRTIEISMTYKAPSRSSHLGFEIVKLSAAFFKGTTFDEFPIEVFENDYIPAEFLSVANKVLSKNKNNVLVKGELCDLEIKDLTETETIEAAYFRKIPWAKKKTIIFSGGKNNLTPGQAYIFRYSIRCLPPTGAETSGNKKVIGNLIAETNPWSFFALTPKAERKEEGQYNLQSQDYIYGIPTGMAESVLAGEIEKLTMLQLPIKAFEQGALGRGIYIERIPQGASSGLPPEGFEILTKPDKVIIRGANERACLYGVYAAMGSLRHTGGRWQLRCGAMRDWPDLPVRGVCIEMLKPAIRDVALMKSYLDAFSRARSNVVIFLHTPQQMRSWYNNENDGEWTKDQMMEIAQYARSLQMDVWGGMGSSFNALDFKEIDVSNGTNFYDPFADRSYNYLFSMYGELLQVYHPSTLMISHDEIQGLSVYAEKSGKSTAEILYTDVGTIHAWLTQRNVKTAMWGDMLLDFNVWDKDTGAANSQKPFFNSGATHDALKHLPSDILILDWHYEEKKDFDSIDYFRKNGFTVIGAPWHNPQAARSLVQSAKKYGGQGVITTDWGFWRTLSPAATTLYAPLCGWSTACVFDCDNRDVTVLAKIMRDRDYIVKEDQLGQHPVGLEAGGNTTTTGLFGFGRIFDLRALSSGKQNFNGINFEVLSDKGRTMNNCIVNAKGDRRYPEESIVFQGIISAQKVAFLHTSLVEEPQYRPRKLGQYLVEYENGQKATLDLLENWNISDIRSNEDLRHNDWTFTRGPDVLIGARTGWRGFSPGGIPLNLQVFAWRNPYPDQKICSIKLNVGMAPQNSKIALVGLTFLQ